MKKVIKAKAEAGVENNNKLIEESVNFEIKILIK